MGDPLLDSLYAEAIVAVLSTAARSALGTIRRHWPTEWRDILTDDAAVATAIEHTIQQLTEVEAIAPEVGGERLRAFLTSAECRHALEPIFYVDGLEPPLRATLQESFAASLQHATGISKADAAAHGPRLFDALVVGAQRALRLAIGDSDGELPAHEALSQMRHAMLRDALANLERNVALLAGAAVPSREAIHAYRVEYCRQVAQREGTIVPPHLDGQRRRPLDAVYVIPHLQPEPQPGEKATRSLSYDGFLGQIRRTVVLGDPGGGKTTLTKKIAWDLSSGRLAADAPPMPPVAIRVILRDYGAAKSQNGWSLLGHIEATASSRYQMPAPPPGLFEYLLRNGLAVVLFDGLDELLDTSRRREISADVESFANLYPATPILITSRRVGYDQAPLDVERFKAFGLPELNVEQVQEYAVKAFALDSLEPVDADGPLMRAFMTESKSVADLRSNPLMLGLMCNLYRGEHYIPANRPAIYEKCALMLFELWDRQRQISSVSFESDLRFTMEFIAHWIYSDADLQSGVTRERLIQAVSEYLHGRRIADAGAARDAATKFVDLCRGRAWVFTDTGTNAQGEALFQFTHRTFLEYFTASYLVATNATPVELAETILPHAASREWEVVLQLAVQLQGRRLLDSTDVLIKRLLTAEMSATGHRNTAAFVEEALEFLIPSPAVVERIVRAAVATEVRYVLSEHGEDPRSLYRLRHAGPAVRDVVIATLVDELVAIMEQDAIAPALVDWATHSLSSSVFSNALWDAAQDKVCARTLPRLLTIAETDPPVAVDLVWREELSIETLVERHGAEPLLAQRQLRYPGGVATMSLIGHAFLELAIQSPKLQPTRMAHQLADVLRQTPTPWARRHVVDRDPYRVLDRAYEAREVEGIPSDAWDADARLIGFVTAALLAETWHDTDEPDTEQWLHGADRDHERSMLGQIECVAWSTAAPDRGALADELLAPQDAQLVRAWIDGSVRLTY